METEQSKINVYLTSILISQKPRKYLNFKPGFEPGFEPGSKLGFERILLFLLITPVGAKQSNFAQILFKLSRMRKK